MSSASMLENIRGIFRFGDRSPMANDQNIRVDGFSCVRNLLNQFCCLVQRHHTLCAHGSFGRQTCVGHKDVCPRLRHFERIAGIENIGRGQQTERVRLCNHFYLEVIAHAGLFEMETKHSIVEPDCREVLYSRESSVFQLFKKNRFEAKRVGAADSSQHRSVLDHRQHLPDHMPTITFLHSVMFDPSAQTARRPLRSQVLPQAPELFFSISSKIPVARAANCGSLMLASTSTNGILPRKFSFRALKQLASASGSQNALPGLSNIETPFSGTTTATDPIARLAVVANIFPIRAF